jgi:hypothetical protein
VWRYHLVMARDDNKEGDGRRWSLGALSRSGDAWQIRAVRDLNEEAVAGLRPKFEFIHHLAQQEAFTRFLSSARRWQPIISEAEEEFTEEGVLSRRTQQAAGEEAPLTLSLALAVERDLLSDLEERLGRESAGARALRAARDRLRTAEPMLLFANALGEAEESLLAAAGDSIRFSAVYRRPAIEVLLGATGCLAALVRTHLELLRGEFQPIYEEIEALAAEVGEGSPQLFRFPEKPGSAGSWQLLPVPVNEARAIRHVLNQRSGPLPTLRQVQEMAVIDMARLDRHLLLGAVDTGHSITGGDVHEGIEQFSTAEVELDPKLLGSAPIDYWATVRFIFGQGDTRLERFKGSVKRAELNDGSLELDLEGAAELAEHSPRGTLAAGMSPEEVITALVRQSGLPLEAIRMEDPPEPGQVEEFELLAPVRGIAVRSELQIGPGRLLPFAAGEAARAGLDPDEADEAKKRLVEEFRQADSYLQVVKRTGEIDIAEDQALGQAQVAMAWLVVRSRYGEARMPGGVIQGFSRDEAVRVPELGPVVLVRGKETGRRWLRWPRGRGEPAQRTLDTDSAMLTPGLPENVPERERQALLALERAIGGSDPLAQAQALWQAIEAYISATKALVPLFTDDDLVKLRERLGEDWDERQSEKLDVAVRELNKPPANVRLRWRLRRDGVRITNEELALLQKLRRARNKVVHGERISSPPTREDVNQGIGLVARMLVQRIAGVAEGDT